MNQATKQLRFIINLALAHSKVTRHFDTGLGNGLGFNDFIVLYHLSQAPEQKMRRVDLADRVSLTASGITRMLLPMEKLGLVAREDCEHDGRVSYVKLSPGGRRSLLEAMEYANLKSQELLPALEAGKLKEASDIFTLFSFNSLK